ncbi:unnamed protein product, partial [Symbiodinium sp. CCMP2592]
VTDASEEVPEQAAEDKSKTTPLAAVKFALPIILSVTKCIFAAMPEMIAFVSSSTQLLTAGVSWAFAHATLAASPEASRSITKLNAVKAGKAKCAAFESGFLEARDKLKQGLGTEESQGDGEDAATEAMLLLASLEVHKRLSYRSSVTYGDAVATYFAQRMASLKTAVEEMKELTLGFSEAGDKFWRKDVPDECDIPGLRKQMATVGMQKMDGPKLRKCCDEMLVFSTLKSEMEKFDDGDSETVHSSCEKLTTLMEDSKLVVRYAKALTMETFLIMQLARVDKIGDAQVRNDMAGLVLKYTILLGQNPVGLVEGDLHPVLWNAVQSFKQ